MWISEWKGGLYPRDNSNKQPICTIHTLSTLLIDTSVDIGVDKIPTWYANLAWVVGSDLQGVNQVDRCFC